MENHIGPAVSEKPLVKTHQHRERQTSCYSYTYIEQAVEPLSSRGFVFEGVEKGEKIVLNHLQLKNLTTYRIVK